MKTMHGAFKNILIPNTKTNCEQYLSDIFRTRDLYRKNLGQVVQRR